MRSSLFSPDLTLGVHIIQIAQFFFRLFDLAVQRSNSEPGARPCRYAPSITRSRKKPKKL